MVKALDFAHPATRAWFNEMFATPTRAQKLAWPHIANGDSTLLLAPTGSGKTLTAFTAAIDRLMFHPRDHQNVTVLYITPLKALGADIERNLRNPLRGIAEHAKKKGVSFYEPTIGVRNGDTPANIRQKMIRKPPDILITTPESLYLMLMSRARETLMNIETVIIDEIHSMVATKRGAHLSASLERLVDNCGQDFQRIGLSATQRPLHRVAEYLGGFSDSGVARPVEIVDASTARRVDLTVRFEEADGAEDVGPDEEPEDMWTKTYRQILDLIDAHRSTLIFVNGRALAEKIAAALNEMAGVSEVGKELVFCHHGSMSKDTRAEVEERLKAGELPALVATSSLEMGIDIGAVDLVVQIESPFNIASGLQRIGRAAHHVGGIPKGVVFAKHRGDLLASYVAAEAMLESAVEETDYLKSPLDVLAQHLISMASLGEIKRDDAKRILSRSAVFHSLDDKIFDGVVDMISGHYPSARFSDLRARVELDQKSGKLIAKKGTALLSRWNVGTIPDRGLYGVFSIENGPSKRVGELDEEMVFETKTGDIFWLGTSTWRVEEIDADRVLVSHAPNKQGRMPFWRGDGVGRTYELGQRFGDFLLDMSKLNKKEMAKRIMRDQITDAGASARLVDYLLAQRKAFGLMTSKRIWLEETRDARGDISIAIHSPFGGRVHTPWMLAIEAKLKAEDIRVDANAFDDGIVLRFMGLDRVPELSWLVPRADEVESLVRSHLGGSGLFAGVFRDNAARALLLPRGRPGKRSPFWVQRRRSARLLEVASDYPSFPILLESYRECLQDRFDLPALKEVLSSIEDGTLSLHRAQTERPSPFLSSMLFHFVGNFLYEGDVALAEQRVQALSIDQGDLRRLLGGDALRKVLSKRAIHDVRRELLGLKYRCANADELYQRLLRLGDLRRAELSEIGETSLEWATALVSEKRAAWVCPGERLLVADVDLCRYVAAFDLPIDTSGFRKLRAEDKDPLFDIIERFTRRMVPFEVNVICRRYGLSTSVAASLCARLVSLRALERGAFLPNGKGEEFCSPDILERIRNKSLQQARAEVQPVSADVFCRFLFRRHLHEHKFHFSLDALIDSLEGIVMPAVVLENEILPQRFESYEPGMLDELIRSGDVVWRGFSPLQKRDGKIALYFWENAALYDESLVKIQNDFSDTHRAIVSALTNRGALLFRELCAQAKRPKYEVENALWDLVWSGRVTSDSLESIRRAFGASQSKVRSSIASRRRSSRSLVDVRMLGRWSLLDSHEKNVIQLDALKAFDDENTQPSESDVSHAKAALEKDPQVVLVRAQVERWLRTFGVVTPRLAKALRVRGGFSAIYPLLKAMEATGHLRRGVFIKGEGALQFASQQSISALRSCQNEHLDPESSTDVSNDSETRVVTVLASTDPANPYGLVLPWPKVEHMGFRRSAGNQVLFVDGRFLGVYRAKNEQIWTIDEQEQTIADVFYALSCDSGWRSGEKRRPVSMVNRRSVLSSHGDAKDKDRREDVSLWRFAEEVGFRKGYRQWSVDRPNHELDTNDVK